MFSLNLTELQIEIKEVEKHLSSIRSEIEKLKPKKEEEKFDFDYITELAEKYPLDYLKISNASDIQKSDFIKGLSYLLLNGGRDIYEGLLYITRLAVGIRLPISSQEIYMNGLAFETKDLYNICANIEDYKYSFLIEAFIIANLCESRDNSKLGIVAEFAEILGCDKEDVYVISHIAKSKLVGDLSVLDDIAPPSQNKYSKKFDDYIPWDWLINKRNECAKLCINMQGIWQLLLNSTNVKSIEKREPNGKVVKKGDTLLTYTSDHRRKKIVSEFDGIVYFIENSETSKRNDGIEYTYLYVYVVSYFDDYENFEKWFKKGRRKTK